MKRTAQTERGKQDVWFFLVFSHLKQVFRSKRMSTLEDQYGVAGSSGQSQEEAETENLSMKTPLSRWQTTEKPG